MVKGDSELEDTALTERGGDLGCLSGKGQSRENGGAAWSQGTGPTLWPQADCSVVTRQRPPSYQCLKILHIYFALRHKTSKTIIL